MSLDPPKLERKISSVNSFRELNTSPRGKTYNLGLYDFNFSSIFQYEMIYDALYQFLCSELQTKHYRQLDFLNKMKGLQLCTNFLEKEALATEIIKQFVEKGSEQELYVSSQSKSLAMYEYQQVCTKLKGTDASSLQEDCFEQVFEEIRSALMIELNRDVAPRFLRSKECKNVLQSFIENPKVLVLKQVKEFPYTNEDFSRNYIVEKDFQFMRSLCRDDLTWEIVQNQLGEVNIYFSEHDVLPDQDVCRELNLFKFELTLPFSFERCVTSILPYYQMSNYSPNLLKFKELEHVTFLDLQKMYPFQKNLSPKPNTIALMDVQLNFPATTLRKLAVVCALDYNPEKGEILMVWKPCLHKSFVKKDEKFEYSTKTTFVTDTGKKETVYFIFNFQAFLFKKIDANTTLYTQVNLGDMGGWATNATLLRYVVKKRGNGLRANVIKHIETLSRDMSFENQKDAMSKDPLGKLLVNELK
jgi:hypothetical protein